jgi:hypothetical protein
MRDDDNDYLVLDELEDDPMLQIHGYSSHLNTKNDEVVVSAPPQSRAPPQISLFE